MGGVMAPLSHFVYMAATAGPMHHHEAGHHGHASATGVQFAEAGSEVAHCAYADLFATQMAADAPSSDELSVQTGSEISHHLTESVWLGSFETHREIRGPPSLS